MPPTTALDVARYLVSKVDFDAGDQITNLKLQKLLYYCQAWHLAISDAPLFNDTIEAWVHGPVIHSIWKHYQDAESIPAHPGFDPNVIPDDARGVIDEVWEAYGHHSAATLRNQTHKDSPWREARAGLPDGRRSRASISHASMRDFYRSVMRSS